MNWLCHVWVFAETFMTDLSLCLVTGVITEYQYCLMGTEKKKIQEKYLSTRKYMSDHSFQLGLCLD